MDVRLRIDVGQGVVEVEGPQSFVESVYTDFKSGLLSRAGDGKTPRSSPPRTGEKAPPRKTTRSKGPREGHAIVKDLDLVQKGQRPGLKDFYTQYVTRNYQERNVLFVFYLQRHAELDYVTADHVYTCYKALNLRVPTALNQSLWDTASRKGWIDTTSLEDIKLSTAGENYVEHDAPKAGAGEE